MFKDIVKVGDVLYHKTGEKCRVLEINEDTYLIIEKAGIKMEMQIKGIGEFLFFREDDINLDIKDLINDKRYKDCGNKKIWEFVDKSINKPKLSAIVKQKQNSLSSPKPSFNNINKPMYETNKTSNNEKKENNKMPAYSDDNIEINSVNKKKRELLEMLVTKYRFDGFHHYTDFENFITIMKEGVLYSRKNALKKDFVDAADQDIISKTDERISSCVRFYYKEQTPTFYCNEGIKVNNESPHMPLPVLLLFDKKLIYLKNVKFSDRGCGKKNAGDILKNIDGALKFFWDVIFKRGVRVDCMFDTHLGPILFDKEEQKKMRNAEFLVEDGKIDIKENISKIIFRSEADKKMAEIFFGENKLFCVDRNKFFNETKYNINFLTKYNMLVTDDCINVNLQFYRPTANLYKHKIKMSFDDKTIEVEEFELKNYREVSLKFKLPQNKRIINAEYYMNGIRSAIWRKE